MERRWPPAWCRGLVTRRCGCGRSPAAAARPPCRATPTRLSVSWSGDGRPRFSAAVNGVAIEWDLAGSDTLPAETRSRYTNAKVLLVGDSGVGKTGLAHRLHGGRIPRRASRPMAPLQPICPLPARQEHRRTSEREIWLWDFAGQADYRLIHQLFMDETALAVLVFNPQKRQPVRGAGPVGARPPAGGARERSRSCSSPAGATAAA